MAVETIDAVYAGHPLAPKEQALYDTHPNVTCDLLKNIPRMDAIAWMIAHQNQPTTVDGDISDQDMAEMRMGAELLRIALGFDSLVRQGRSRTEAAHTLGRLHKGLDSRILMALVEVEPEAREKKVRTCRIEEIAPGMVIDQDIRTESGLLITARNQEVTSPLILKLKNYYEKGAIAGDIVVSVP